MGKRLRDLKSAENIDKNFTYLLVDSEGFDEGEKVLLKDISLNDFNQGNFYSKDQINGNFVKVQPNKDLSSNDFTDEYIEQINQKATKKELEQVKNIAEGANQAVVFNNYAEVVETFLNAKVGDFKKGQNILIADLGVPDLWISFSTIIFYNTTAEDFEKAIRNLLPNNENGQMTMIGHYGFSVLETQKVDLTNYIKNTDYGGYNQKGVIGLSGNAINSGLQVSNGLVSVFAANKERIDAKTSWSTPIVPNFMDYAWKVSATTNTEEWTDEEKASARTLIGAAPSTSPVKNVRRTWISNGFEGAWVDMQINAASAVAGHYALYLKEADGDTAAKGYLNTNIPTRDYHAANKKYVDDIVGNINGALDELHSYAQSLITGGVE